ncbi:MAG: YihY/virulence factor BrkB family protein [Planctomycetota bacterium]|nr:YihY/virulence factor BrkB family protein [Planctomycetota bacterium]
MFSRIWQLTSETVRIWFGARSAEMAAAMAYYAMLSVAPTLVIATAVAGWIYDEQLVERKIVDTVSQVTTPEIAQVIADIIGRAQTPQQGIVAGTISVVILLTAASMVFTQLYSTLNLIWHVDQPKGGFWFNMRIRLAGLILVLSVGVLLITALILQSLAGQLSHLVVNYPSLVSWISLIEQQLTFLFMPLILSVMFWLFPATKLKFIDVIPAGFLTALMVAGSHYFIDLYLSYSSTSEVYGAMGSLVVMLVWTYLLAMILFLGASFSRAWAHTFGSRRAKPSQSDVGTPPQPSTIEN